MNETMQFLKRLMGIRLSANERLAMRERLVAYADMHPAPEPGSVPSPFTAFFGAISSRRFSAYALVAVLIVMSGGSITLAAEGSAPGDALYNIKIHVNEPVMTTLAPTATAQARVAANIASRRVDEAVTLASRGALTDEREAYLTKEFDARVAIATKKVEDLRAQGDAAGAETAQADLAVRLAGEAQALGAVTAKDSKESTDLLRVVVATSQRISGTDMGEDSPVAVATLAVEDSAEATEEVHPVATLMRTAKMKTTLVGTTTPRATTTPHALHVTASTTLRALAPMLEASGLLMPKTDRAIPESTSDETSLDSAIVGSAHVNE